MYQVLRSTCQFTRWRASLRPVTKANLLTGFKIKPYLSAACVPSEPLVRNGCSSISRRSWQASSCRPRFRPLVTAGTTEHMHTNRLAQEESPYLLQHQHNPVSTTIWTLGPIEIFLPDNRHLCYALHKLCILQVDWYPWSNEAFAKAAKEDKPIFLSVGYSTCHW